jgi:hypothetical protein
MDELCVFLKIYSVSSQRLYDYIKLVGQFRWSSCNKLALPILAILLVGAGTMICRDITVLLCLMLHEEKCVETVFELVSHYMLVSFCGGGTRFRFGGQSVHMRKDREMLSLGRLYNKDSDVHAVLRQSKVR